MSLTANGVTLSVVGDGDTQRIRAAAAQEQLLSPFEGVPAGAGEGSALEGPLSARNAAAIRACLPWLAPRPVGLRTSAGVGDRLGLATPGHVEAFRASGQGVAPVFAQQSARELDRLGRAPQDVLDAATFGCLKASWEQPVGADADHLKTADDIDRFLQAGFTTFTLDPGDSVTGGTSGSAPEIPWAALEDDPRSMVRRYSAVEIEVGGTRLAFPADELHAAAAKYGAAIVTATRLYRHLMGTATGEIEVEIAVDETDQPTTPLEHAYMATEMKRLGLHWVGFAPRYVGEFEKGVEYIGSVGELRRSIAAHAAVARALGPYKLSLHSASDKFSIYDDVAAATSGLVHVKTSGTSYLVALQVAAASSPELFRRIYSASRSAYLSSRASYHVSAALERTAAPEELPDHRLLEVVNAPESRQILHVGYAAALSDPATRTGLRQLLGAQEAEYASQLKLHIGRHLTPFSRMSAA